MMPYILILVILTLLWLGAFWRIKRKQNINLLAGFLFFMFLSTFASFLVMLGINYSNRLVYLLLQFVKYTYITKKLPDIILGSFKLLLIYLVFL